MLCDVSHLFSADFFPLGTVYSLLYSLERNGLIEGTWNERKRVYKLTEKGEKIIEIILNANDKIKNFITNLLKIHSTA